MSSGSDVPDRTLIRGGIVLPLDQPGDVFDPGSVLIEGKDIVAVGSIDDLDLRAEGATVIDASGQAVIPGLHNSHLHSGLLRGTAESMSLWDWLRTYVDPAHKALTPETARAAAMQAYAARPAARTTSAMHMSRVPVASAAGAAGLGRPSTLAP